MDTQSIHTRARTRAGAVALIGLGAMMLLIQITPHSVHGALTLTMFALTFGGVYALGGPRFDWARFPALVFSLLATFVFVSSLAGESMRVLWPLWLVFAGLWFLRPRRRTTWV
jgi:hypothetical protein